MPPHNGGDEVNAFTSLGSIQCLLKSFERKETRIKFVQKKSFGVQWNALKNQYRQKKIVWILFRIAI